jgi:hypothetical protein
MSPWEKDIISKKQVVQVEELVAYSHESTYTPVKASM